MQQILQNTRTDTRYVKYYPCTMHTLIFPSKLWAKCALRTATSETADVGEALTPGSYPGGRTFTRVREISIGWRGCSPPGARPASTFHGAGRGLHPREDCALVMPGVPGDLA